MAAFAAPLLATGTAGGLSAGAVGLAAGGSLIPAAAFVPALGTLGTIGTVLKVGQAVSEFSGAGVENAAAAEAARFNQKVAIRNANIANQQTAAEVDRAERERRLRLGANIAGAGANKTGIDSSLDILLDNAVQEELNIATIKSDGLLREQNFLIEGQLQGNRARSQSQQAGFARQGGLFGVGTSILSASGVA